jgi:SagB-type dehydrogenase family enzyme
MSNRSWQLATRPTNNDDALWELFHENSKASPHLPFLPDELASEYAKQMNESLAFDPYPEVKLPEAATLPPVSIQEAIAGRALLAGELEPCSLSPETVGAILRYSYGVIDGAGDGEITRRPRAVYSTDSYYPLEIFLHSTRIEGIGMGLYHYNPPRHSLRLLRGGDSSHKLSPGFMEPRIANRAALLLFIAAMPERTVFQYGDRGYRFAMMEAGAVVQNLNLVVGALGLTCVNIGGYFDREIDGVLGLDGLTISTIYVVAIGKGVGESLGTHLPLGGTMEKDAV